MAPKCSPTSQKSYFFRITSGLFLCLVMIHQLNLAKITTHRASHKSTDIPQVPTENKLEFDPFTSITDDIYNWNESTPVKVFSRSFTSSEGSRVLILGVVAKNSTPTAHWDQYAVYGQWYDHALVNASHVKCCFRYADGTITEHPYAHFDINNYSKGMTEAQLMTWHITCDRPPREPRWVSISQNSSCSSGMVTFIRPFFATRKPEGHMVITTKMAYTHMEPETIIGFLEAARYFGIDKVITYVMDDLEPELKRIMRYYAYMGILDYYVIELGSYPPAVNAQYRSDEWLVKWDALERSVGSTYFGIFDMDEYLVTSRNRSYKQLLSDLQAKHPMTSHFFFRNVHYFTDYDSDDPTCSPNCSIFRRHVMSLPVRFNNVPKKNHTKNTKKVYACINEKMLLIISRVVTSTVTNQCIQSVPGYARAKCSISDAYLTHYGSCKKFGPSVCGNASDHVKDTSMIDWAESTGISRRIQKARVVLHA